MALQVLSLGAGVQSTALLLMSALRQLPKLDAAVFSDTGWEAPDVYENVEWLRGVAADADIPFYVVDGGNIHEDAKRSTVRGKTDENGRFASMPLFVREPGKRGGMITRQCTKEYKIRPIRRFLKKELLGLKKHESIPLDSIHQWMGISADEIRRVKASRDHWIVHVYPLVGIPGQMLPKPYTRHDCVRWLAEHFPGHSVPRSACVGCPFKSDAEWRYMKRNQPEAWDEAVALDAHIRKRDMRGGEVFLHRSMTPLSEVDLRNATERGQGELFADMREECLGYCGT